MNVKLYVCTICTRYVYANHVIFLYEESTYKGTEKG